MFKSKRELTERRMPTAEEFALWGAYELSFEELLAVNGGKREKKEKSGKSSGGGKSSKSSGGGGGSSKGFFGSGSKKSSGWGTKSKETNKEKKTKTQTGTTGTERRKNGNGTSAGGGLKGGEPKSKEEKKSRGAEYTVRKGDTLSDIVRKQYPGASKEEIVRRVKEAAANSGIKDIDKIEPGQKIIFEKPAQSSSGGEPVKQNKREGKAPIAGGTAGGGTSREERRTSSGRGSLWGGRRESGYRPETGVRTGGGQPLSENKAQTGMRQEEGMQNTETQGVRSKISGFFDRLWNKFGNVNKTNAESYVEKSRGGNWQSKENFPVPPVSGKAEIDSSKLNWEQALEACKGFNLEGHNCDVYSTEVLEAGNKKPKDWPDPANTIVAETKERKGANYLDYYKDDLVTSPQDGWNAMFMTDGTNDTTVDAPHLAVAYQNNNGSISLTHYTANEIRTRHFDNLRLAETAFGYSKFQYLPLGQ